MHLILLATDPNALRLGDWVTIGATIVTGIVALLALFVSSRSLKRTDHGLYADVLLRLDQEMREHREVHALLRTRGKWTVGNAGPKSPDELIMVEAYMGLFERINYFVDHDLITIDYVERFYGYRYQNIRCNPIIAVEKLKNEADDWKDFIELGRKLEHHNSRHIGAIEYLRDLSKQVGGR